MPKRDICTYLHNICTRTNSLILNELHSLCRCADILKKTENRWVKGLMVKGLMVKGLMVKGLMVKGH